MVGFIGKNVMLSSPAVGLLAEEHDVLALSDGRIINAYLTDTYGPIHLMELKGPNAEPTKIGEYLPEVATTRLTDFSLFETKGGDITMIVKRPSGSSYAQDQIVMQRFTGDGALKGEAKPLAEGLLVAPKAIPLKNGGFFLRYLDRSVEDKPNHERLGVFYDASGKEVGRQVFDPTATFTSTGIAEAAVLKNGNVAVAYGVQAGGTVTQVFTQTGAPVTPLRTVSEDNRSLTMIAALPDGGYVVSYAWFSPVDTLRLQRFDATGKPVGREIVLDNGAAGVSIGQPDLAITKEGLIAVTWSGQTAGGTTDADIHLTLLTQGGDLVFGPAIVNSIRTDKQDAPQFDVLKDGQLFISYHDEEFKPFVYQDAIQGAYIVSPDSFWQGGNGNDRKNGTPGDDVMLGLGGDDRLDGLGGGDYIKGGNGNDTLFGGNGGDELLGEAGNDEIDGGKGNDTLSGGPGRDKLDGGRGNDLVEGGDGNDRLSGGGGKDTLNGGDGNDTLSGGGGSDSLIGGTGNDTLAGAGGNDTLAGGDGADVLKGAGGNDYLEGGAGRDVLRGGAGNDVLRGGDDDDRVYGDAGDDIIYSDGGNDKEYGGAGNDTFYDSDGNDKMWGGSGADTFRFIDTKFGRDRIKDFEFGADTLDMGLTARALQSLGADEIRIVEVSAGVRFVVDSANWVQVDGAKLTDFEEGDYILTSPFF